MAGPYYVADSDGDDGYNGLYDHFISGSDGPFKTIGKATTVLAAGEAVYVRTGTYNECVHLTNGVSGGAETRIIYKNYTGESPVIDAQSSRDACFKSGLWASPAGVVHYITIDGFECKNSTESAITFERSQSTQAGSVGSHGITIQNCLTHHNVLYGITIEGGDVGTGGEGYDILITLDVSHTNGGHGIKFQGDSAGTINRLQIRDSEVSWSTSYGNTGVAEGNAQGMHLSTGTHDTIFSFNLSYGNQASGLSTYEAWNMTIEGNASYSNGTGHLDPNAAGLIMWYASNNTVKKNFFRDNYGSGAYIGGNLAGSPTKCFFYYNIIVLNGTGLSTGHGGITLDNALAHDVFNNTLYNNHCCQIYVKTTANHDIKNNIMVSVGGGRAADFLIRIDIVAGWTANKIDYNCYYTTDLTNPWYWNPNQRNTFLLWKSDSSMDEHGMEDDPEFINPGGTTAEDYKVGATSPCRDAGISVDLDEDYFGNLIV